MNARIRESQGQMQQAYTLHVNELAERNDGSIFRDSEVRQRLIERASRTRSSVRLGSGCAALLRMFSPRSLNYVRESGSAVPFTRPSECGRSRRARLIRL